MNDFLTDIKNFQQYGTYMYNFDSSGNLTFNSSSINFNQVYLAFPLQNIIYDSAKIASIYDISFEEFIPTSSSISSSAPSTDNLQQQLDLVQQENITLKNQLDLVIAQNEISGSSSNTLAIQQVILELRIALGQGRVNSDFSVEFPYTPIIKPTL